MARWQSFSPVWNQYQDSPLWKQLHGLHQEMNRVFDRWSDGGSAPTYATSYPLVNVWEDGEVLHLEAELPGLTEKELELYVTGGNRLTIKGERTRTAPEKGVWHRQERGVGTFVRVLTLPYNVDGEKVEAHFENGVLKVKLPKHEAAKPRKIAVKSE